jgi:hypothetical protein
MAGDFATGGGGGEGDGFGRLDTSFLPMSAGSGFAPVNENHSYIHALSLK